MSTFNTGLTGDLSLSRLGKPGGFAPLGLDNKVPSINLPAGLAGGLALQGGYDANSNIPDLTAGAQQSNGNLYIVTVEGTQDIGNGSELFTVGDAVFYSTGDARWYKLEGSTLGIEVSYDNGASGLVAVNVQDAIDEVVATTSGALLSTNNLSDLDNIEIAKSNLDIRTKLLTDTTFYVNPSTGLDTNDGLTPGTAFQTIGALDNFIQDTYDLNGKSVTIQLADGTYNESDLNFEHYHGSARELANSFDIATFLIIGNTTNPENVIITGVNWFFTGQITYEITGLTFDASTIPLASNFISVGLDSSLIPGIIRFNNDTNVKTCFQATNGGKLNLTNTSNITLISGTYGEVIVVGGLNSEAIITSSTFTLENALTINSFFYARGSSIITIMAASVYNNPSNSTGFRFRMNRGGRIFIESDPNIIPGSAFIRFDHFNANYEEGEINGTQFENLWRSITLTGDVSLNLSDFRNVIYTTSVNRQLTLPISDLYRPLNYILVNSSSSSGNITIRDSLNSINIAVIRPGQTYLIQQLITNNSAPPYSWVAIPLVTQANESYYDNGTSGLVATNVKDAIDELATSIGTPLALQTERTTLTANRTLTNADKGILNVEVDNASFDTITLPAAPDTDRRFLIRNRPSSVAALTITGQDVLPPGALWEGVYDGVEWITI